MGTWQSHGLGKIVENALSHLNLCILNDGSNTYFTCEQWFLFLHWLNNCRSFFTPRFTLVWHDDLCGSDHFTVIVEWMMKTECTENWKLNKADWTLFENLCLKNILTKEIEKQSDPIRKFTESLISFAKNCKPKILTNSKRIKRKTWFTEDCKQAIKARKKHKDSSRQHQRCLI